MDYSAPSGTSPITRRSRSRRAATPDREAVRPRGGSISCPPAAGTRRTPPGRGSWGVRVEAILVPHTGFEPVISALRGRCPGPLDECGRSADVAVRPVAEDTRVPPRPAIAGGVGQALQAVRL